MQSSEKAFQEKSVWIKKDVCVVLPWPMKEIDGFARAEARVDYKTKFLQLPSSSE